MAIFLGRRDDGFYGLFISPDGIDPKTCALSQLTYNCYDQAQAVEAGSYNFGSADIYNGVYYRKIINIPNQGITPIVNVLPNKNTRQLTGASYQYRGDQSLADMSSADDWGDMQAVFKHKVSTTQLTVICHKKNYIGFSYLILNRAY